jgi:two-component system, OmpR family, phosphate regulon sensor histidine kinase PhoR
MRDISDRRQIEKMQREFTTLITHELKAPLTSLKGFAQLLQRRREYDDGAVEVILGRTNHLERLINDLLDVASTDSGKLTLRRANVDLVTIAGRNVEQARATTSAHEIRFTAPREAIVGWWDSGRLSQVLQNLLANAIKYSPCGGLIEVTIEAMDGVGRVIVSDDGIGIPDAHQARIFERFYKVDRSRARDQDVEQLGGSAGLGLAIVRHIAEAHRGSVGVSSEEGVGSTFWIEVPRAGD